MKIFWDTEANGNREEATHFWCLVFKNEAGQKWRFIKDGNENRQGGLIPISKFKETLPEIIKDSSDKTPATFVCHNLYGYDLPLLRRLHGINYGYNFWGSSTDRVIFICSLEFSRTLHPDRRRPQGCPPSIHNPITGKMKRIGGHGLEARGYDVGVKKVEIFDWRDGDPLAYLKRCEEDVEITRLNYMKLNTEFKQNRL